MKRVLVIGAPGAGKSTFAKALHEITGLPLYHLDLVWYKENKTRVSRPEFDVQVLEIMKGEKWILDGNFQRTMEMRMKECDTVFLLNYPVEVCLEGIRERVGQKREDFRWVDREVNPELVQKAIDFSRDKLPRTFELLKKYPNKKFIQFKTREESEKYLRELADRTRAKLVQDNVKN